MGLFDRSEFGAGGYDVAPDYGWLNAPAPDSLEALKKAAALQLAAKMRQQSPSSTPPVDGANSFADQFDAGNAPVFGSLAPPLPPATNVGPAPGQGSGGGSPTQIPTNARYAGPIGANPADGGAGPAPANALDNLYLSTAGARPPSAIAAPTVSAPQGPQQAPQTSGAAATPSFLNKAIDTIKANPGLLLGMAAGFAGAPSFGTGMQRAFSNAAPFAQENQTVQALIKRGIPEGDARMMATNPQLLTAALQKRPIMAKGLMGEDIPLTFDELTGTYRDTNGRVLGQGGSGSANQPSGSTEDAFNQIAQQRANGATTDQLLQNVPQQMREGVSALISGKAIPANMGMRSPARAAAINWAHAIDPNFDETLIPERVKFANGMAQTSPNSFGGQKLLMNTALQHFGDAADYISQLHNTAGPLPGWTPGSNTVGQHLNSVRNSSAENAAIVNALNDTVDKGSGEVGKLYSGAQGGGENERLQTQSRFANYRTPGEFAGALEATRNLIYGKLNSLKMQRDQVYGKNGENIFPLLDPQTKEALNKIDKTIAKLRGTSPAQNSPALAAPENKQSGESSSAAAQQAIPAPAERRVGQIYQTPRGPGRWVGIGWQTVK